MGERIEPERVSRRAWIGRFLGPVLAILLFFILPTGDGGLSLGGRATVAIGILMAVWWVTEALPLPATALLPLALFPITGVLSMEDAAAPYANDLIFLFMGGFLLALAMQRWGLHRRIALQTIRAVGTTPVRMIGGFMIASAGLSMWVSNTATTVMMLPIGLAVLTLVFERVEGQDTDEGELTGAGAPNFATGLMLGIAYAASIGSLATIIGTPPNTFLIAYLQENHDISIGFGQWFIFGLPLAAVFLVIAWIVITRFMYPPQMDEIPGGRELIADEIADMGPMSRGEKVVLGVFIVTALLWISRSLFLQDIFAGTTLEGIDDAAIGIGAAILLFAWPIDREHGVFALDWETARQLPWGILLLFGGGLSLAAAVGENGVDTFIGRQVEALGGLPTIVLILFVVAIVILLTELTSNTATTAAVVPILGGVATGLGYGPMVLVVPAALAATCAFMLPVATPPNAIVFGSGHITIQQMARIGVILNFIGLVLITLLMAALAGPVLGVSFSSG
ncbi:MAG: DASS family sodium-coupled anion symporter [Actinobacteria bacterium]|nr:DASS family sodium-coupled anion symporter [Actinomycetota bacterium]